MARISTALVPDLTIDAVSATATLSINMLGQVSYNAEVTLSANTVATVENFNDGATAFLALVNPTGGAITLTPPTGHYALADEAISVAANSRSAVIVKRVADDYYWSSAAFVAIT